MSELEVAAVAAATERELRAAGTPERALHEKAYLKSSLEHAGASLPAIRGLAKRIKRKHPALDAPAVFALARELWAEPLHERRMLAVRVLEQYADRLGPSDLEQLEPLLRDSRTWALVDGLAGDVAATVVLHFPDDAIVDSTLRRWAHDEDFWVRRSAVLAHLKTVDAARWRGGLAYRAAGERRQSLCRQRRVGSADHDGHPLGGVGRR